MNGAQELIVKTILELLSSFDTSIAKAIDVLTGDIFSSAMYGMATAIALIIKPVALVIISICFVVEFLNIAIKMDILKWEWAARVIFKLLFAKVAVDVCSELLLAIYATGAEWITKAGGAMSSTLGIEATNMIEDMVKSLNFMEAIGLLITMGIAFFAIWISGIIILVIAYARMFELYIYIAISPLPCAFLPMENSRITKKFFLNFAGVVLQGLFIIIAVKLYQMVCAEAIVPAVQSSSSIGELTFQMLLGALVLVMAVIKSGQWAKTILDAM